MPNYSGFFLEKVYFRNLNGFKIQFTAEEKAFSYVRAPLDQDIYTQFCFLKNNLQDMSLLRYPAGGIWQKYWHLAWRMQQDLIDLNSFCGWGENRLE